MKKKLLSTLLLAGTLLIGSTVSAYAQDVSSDPLQPYEDRLEELSTELGTDLAIVAPEDGTIEDAIDFYSSMSMDEFDSYVKDAYEEAESLDVVTEEYVSEESSSLDVAPLASIAYYQKYFYNSGSGDVLYPEWKSRDNFFATVFSSRACGWIKEEVKGSLPDSCCLIASLIFTRMCADHAGTAAVRDIMSGGTGAVCTLAQ